MHSSGCSPAQQDIIRKLGDERNERLRGAARELRDAGCCAACVVRMLGEQSPRAIADPALEASLTSCIGVAAALASPLPSHRAPTPSSRKTLRAFITTSDASLFSGAKLVQAPCASLTELTEGVRCALGLEAAVSIELTMGGIHLTTATLATLPPHPRFEVRRTLGIKEGVAPEGSATAQSAVAAVAAAAAAKIARPEPDMSDFVCTVCLGVAQRCAQWVSEAGAQIASSGFVLDPGQPVRIGVSLPSDVLVRQRLISSELRLPYDAHVDLKTVMHELLTPTICATLGAPVTSGDASLGFGGRHNEHAVEITALQLELSWSGWDPVPREAAELARACAHRQPEAKRQRYGGKGKGGGKGGGGGSDKRLELSWGAISNLLMRTDDAQLRSSCRCPPKHPTPGSWPQLTVEIRRPSLWIAGRYNKYERGLSQTPWRYGKPGDSSVEEEISTLVLPVFGPLECKFSSGGREDKDVRMLGGGRPFTLELVSAKRTLLAEGSSEARASRLRALEIEVNARAAGRVCVSGLRLVEKEYTDAVKATEETKRKSYRCVCWIRAPGAGVTAVELSAALDACSVLHIDQLTPIRVLHRRTSLVRPKQIHSMRTEWINRKCFILDLQTSAGTYVKEFVHGDMGRTNPNVGTLLGKATDILQLDVLDIDYT